MHLPPKKAIRKKITELTLFAGLLLLLFYTDLGKVLSSYLQRAVMFTGALNAEGETSNYGDADYLLLLKRVDDSELIVKELAGKVIFMNYWATWCPPCVAEMPSIEGLYEQFEDNEDVAFLIISGEDDHEKVRSFISRKGYKMPVYHLLSPKPSIYQTGLIPSTFVINKRGEVVYKKSGIAQYDNPGFIKLLNDLATEVN